MEIRGFIFDKDGTLFDFQRSWGSWFASLLTHLAAKDAALLDRLAQRMHFDMATARFDPSSVFIAGTQSDMIAQILDLMPAHSPHSLRAHMASVQDEPAQVPAIDLPPFLDDLRSLGHKLAIATNDNERSARAQLATAGVLNRFHAVAGYDSGYGAKPAPGMLLGVAAQIGLPPESLIMVGDSTHDMHSGRAAGMRTIGVLTGTASRADLTPHADIVLNHIGEIRGWLSKTT